jgi:replicative DNA helicase
LEEQTLPMAIESEESVLGSILVDPESIDAIDLRPSDFFAEEHQLIFQSMIKLRDASNQITVAQDLADRGKLQDIGGVAYLSHLVSITPTSLHIAYYAEAVKRCSFNRKLISSARQIESIGHQNKIEIEAIDDLNQIVKQLATSVSDNSVLSPDKISMDAFNYLTNKEAQKALRTGIQPFDDTKGGYLMGEYVMLAGRTGKGKTTLALQQACNIAEANQVLFFSMEMFQQQITNKNIARITGIPEKAISLKGCYTELAENGKYVKHYGFTDSEWKSILSAIDKLSKLNLYVAEGNRSLDSIRMLVEKQLNTTGCDIVFIDYLGLIREKQGRDGHDRYNFLSEELSRMPKEYRIPFVVLHQLNREVEYRSGEAHAPKITDVREGGEESVDLLLVLSRCVDDEDKTELYDLKDRLRGEPCIITIGWDGVRYY